MPLSRIQIVATGGILSGDFELNPRLNIICGPNGIGKTTILECIAHAFAHRASNTLKRHALSNGGKVRVQGTVASHAVDVFLDLKEFEPDASETLTGNHQLAYWLLYLRSTRDFHYQKLGSIGADPKITAQRNAAYQQDGLRYNDVKNWFIQRFLFSAHKDSLSKQQISNLDFAKACFEILHKDFSFSKVDGKRFEIIVHTPTGDIPLEFLSSGFRSCIALIFGIIKEIEYRFPPEQSLATEFQGVILIDEIELHLHPDWQKRICDILTKSFPNAQFIVSTHSPHVIQTAEPASIIALRRDSDGNVIKNIFAPSEYGFRGWTIEEILTEVMGMTSTYSEEYQSTIRQFSLALSASKLDEAEQAFNQIDQMLHPSNMLRQILKIQLSDAKAKHD